MHTHKIQWVLGSEGSFVSPDSMWVLEIKLQLLNLFTHPTNLAHVFILVVFP